MRSTSVPMSVMAAESLTAVSWRVTVCRKMMAIKPARILAIMRNFWRQ